ncbi:MAG: dehydratase [SAR202 cluster bacterium]|nr:dehydratase [SAR202 cluster bacterium]|tara:strand:- start:17 stop:451 length:435 start_codon:yes stop_codon:yes gene_type:complete
MHDQRFWDDVQVDDLLPVLTKTPTTRQLVQYAGASGDFYEIHYDKDFALNTGLDGVIVHGALKSAFLGQLITDWMGPKGTLRRLNVQYRGMDIPGTQLTCTGRISRKYVEDGQHLVDCEIWIKNADEIKTTPGSATVILPRREG